MPTSEFWYLEGGTRTWDSATANTSLSLVPPMLNTVSNSLFECLIGFLIINIQKRILNFLPQTCLPLDSPLLDKNGILIHPVYKPKKKEQSFWTPVFLPTTCNPGASPVNSTFRTDSWPCSLQFISLGTSRPLTGEGGVYAGYLNGLPASTPALVHPVSIQQAMWS